jgi:hypothetical protein
MKSYLSFLLFVLVALSAKATDRFYIEDFTINPGETKVVSITLDNAVEYSAFQADLYLPTGLSVVQEDGDYLIDLTTRKGRDHTISSKLHADGALRIMSYSTSLKVYSGNSGALVTMTIAADEGFTGPVTISMNNILFTTPLGEEVAFADETCTVTLPATVNRGDVNNDDRINISDVTALIDFLLSDDDSHINRANSDVNQDGKINISDVTALIDYLLSGHF